MLIEPRTLKGFRDFLPEQMIPRERIIETAKKVYRSFGFAPIDTPALEYLEILQGKGGDESDRLMVAWPTDPAATRPGPPPGTTPIEVDTPEDVVVLRRIDPTEALEWRRRVCKELGERLDAGAIVTAFTRARAMPIRA